MASVIAELLITKLDLLCCKAINYSSSKSQVTQCISELRAFQKILKGAEDHQTNVHNEEWEKEWEKVLRDIYSVEDIIDPLIWRTILKRREVFIIKMRLNNKIGELRSNVKRLLNLKGIEVNYECMHIQPTCSDAIQQAPSSSELGTGIAPISEDNTPATVNDPDLVGAQLPTRRSPSENWSTRVDNVAENASIPNATDKTWDEAGVYLEGKSVTVLEVLVNKLAQPVLSSSKLQCLILKADVSSSGKAILLWTVYNAETVKQHFHFHAWLNVSELSEEIQIVNAILEQCNDEKEEDEEVPRSAERRLHDFLVSKRFLIVLYGVQEDILWDKLEPIFPYSLNGSRVILAIPQSTDGSKSIGKASDESPPQHLVKSSGYLEENSSIIGAKAVIHELTEKILSPIRPFLISIVGVAGLGKETLLWVIYNAQEVQLHFQCRAWIHVPEVYKEIDLLTSIWEQVKTVKTEEKLSLPSLRENLRTFLTDKKYLVVLYDVWKADIWEIVKKSLPESSNGGRVVLAVQEFDVARKTKSWIFRITSEMGLLDDLNDMQENASERKHAKRWERLADLMDEASVIVGLEDKIRELAEPVLNNYRVHFLISVLGVAGSGKTTFVRTFYNSNASKQHFECRAWISVRQDFEERDMLLDLFGQLRKVKVNRSLSVEQLRKGLSLFLTWKRYLIILDDVRTPDIWNRLNPIFPNSSNGSRVILTTRNAYLAYHMNPRAVVLSLRPLNDDESWKLFAEKVRTSIDDIPSDLKDIPSDLKAKILQRCRGLPLTIVVLGGLLSTKKRGQKYEEWLGVMEQTGGREKKNGVTGKGQLNSSYEVALLDSKPKQEKNEVTMANQMGSSNGKEKNYIEDQSSSLFQLAHSYAKREDDKKKVEDTTTREDQLTSSNQLALSATKQKEARSKVLTDNARSAEDQLAYSDELTSPDEFSLSNVVALTYQHLSFSSKCCLLYLGLFPGSYEIRLRRLLHLWLAEGLVMQPTSKTGSLDLAIRCFQELLTTNMIEIAERRLDGSPKTCRVTNTLYDTLFPNAEKAGFFYMHRSSDTTQTPLSNGRYIRRLAENLDMYIHSNPPDDSIQHLRSYISFYNRKGDAPTSGVSELLNKIVEGGFKMLVVLDLEGVYKPVLSEALGKLRQLKYIGLRRTLLDSVPESVGGLPHLETLDIKETYIITLPTTIWGAKKLQHLYMSEIYVDVSIDNTSVRGSLSNLQTLWGLIIRKKISKTGWLNNLSGLRKLKLTCLEASMSVITDWLSKLTNLRSLKLRSISDSNEPAQLVLGEMKELKNLSRLYLLGKLPKSFKVSELPETLEVLTLSVSRLSEDPMEALGKLEKLKVLRLYAHSVERKSMKCHKDGFPELQVLKLWMLKELTNWTVEGKAMPNLKELEIRCCKKLEQVDGLENLTTLKELTLTNMESRFVAGAHKKIGDRVKITENVWNFSPPWE